MESSTVGLGESSNDFSLATHSVEEMGNGLMLLTDKNTKERSLLYPMAPPYLLSKEEEAFLGRYFHENRAFTDEETRLLLSLTVAPDVRVLEENVVAVLKWFSDLESKLGPLSKKPTPDQLRNPLFWSDCAVEVTLRSGVVHSFVVINQRAPELPSVDVPHPILLSEVESIRPSPYAIPTDVLETARTEGVEIHMGDSLYLVEARGKNYAIDSYFNMRPPSLFFKNGEVKGSEIKKTHDRMSTSILDGLPTSEPLTVTRVNGLW
jgi:hypothetical protein